MESIASRTSTTRPVASLAKPIVPLREHILTWLHAVRDLHTGMSILRLGMVEEVMIDRQHVTIVCRCPQAWYTNAASLALAGEIHNRLAGVPGVRTIDVVMLSEGSLARHSSFPTPSIGAHERATA